jgi:hypothetical protein
MLSDLKLFCLLPSYVSQPPKWLTHSSKSEKDYYHMSECVRICTSKRIFSKMDIYFERITDTKLK